MRGISHWSFDRYLPPLETDPGVYVCRIEPRETEIEIEYKPAVSGYIDLRMKDGDGGMRQPVDGGKAVVAGLRPDVEYEFTVTCGEKRSRVRYVHTGIYPGKVINYLHPNDRAFYFSGSYLASPSIVRLPDGALLASCDVFDGARPMNLSLVFRSDDNGASWRHTCDLVPCFWGKLFVHRGEVYMLAVSGEYGDLLIGKSSDGGFSFCTPTVIFRGSDRSAVGGPHKAPMALVSHAGRLWTGVEFGSWDVGLNPSLVSAPEDADLLDPTVWTATEPLISREGWVAERPAYCLEGNAVVTPDGKLVDFARTNYQDTGKTMVFLADETAPEARLKPYMIIDCDFHLSKFTIRRDPVTKKYLTLANRFIPGKPEFMRNLQCLMVSDDLRHWRVAKDVIDMRDTNPETVGLQYADWDFDGDDIIAVTRVGINGAHNYHDSNCITFEVIKNFRELL